MVISAAQSDLRRDAFLDGIKAAFIVGQLNRLGQVLCGRCGAGFDSLEEAWHNLDLHRVIDTDRGGYVGEFEWGEDHPNYLLLACRRCIRSR